MRSLMRSYNRKYYRAIVAIRLKYYYKRAEIKLKLRIDLLRICLVKFLFHLAYKIDADLCKELTGREFKEVS